MNPAVLSETYITICTIITCTAAVASIIASVTKAAKGPNARQDERIAALETDVKQIKQHIDNNNKRIKSIEAGNRITQQALLALMSHAINGNDIDKLEKARDDLQQYLIEKE